MSTYAYVALEPSGKRKTGFVDAANREAAVAAISGSGQFVVKIDEHTARHDENEGRSKRKASRADVALFTRRLADLSGAGLPLDRVLQIVSDQSENGQISEIADHSLELVRGGMPVSQALSEHPKVFPPVFTQTLRSGEASGQFPEVCSRLADMMETEVTRRSQIVSALIYPILLMSASIVVIVVLMTFVVPRLKGVFDKLGGELPGSTQLLLAVSSFIQNDWLYIVGIIVAAFLAYRATTSTPDGAYLRDNTILKLPLVGPIVKKVAVSRFARVLGTLVFGGVPILESLNLAGLASGNLVYIKAAVSVENDVRDGHSIAAALRNAEVFPPTLTHMVAIGEETGEIPKMLGRVASSLDFEVDNGMRRFIAMLEPLIVLAMAVLVGWVVMSVILPIYSAGNLIK